MADFNATPLFNYLGSEIGNMINNVVNVDANINNNNLINNVKYYKNIDENNIYLCLEVQVFKRKL